MSETKDAEDDFKAPVSEVIDKAALTQNWVSACQQDDGMKRKADVIGTGRSTWNSGGVGVKKLCVRPEKPNEWLPHGSRQGVSLDGVCSERDFLQSVGRASVVGSESNKSNNQEACSRTRTSSISSFSSILSDESNEFEEILSDDDLNTSSSMSRKSGAGSETAKNSDGDRQPVGDGNSVLPTLKWSFLTELSTDVVELNVEKMFEVLQVEEAAHSKLMVCYNMFENEEEASAPKKKPRKDALGEVNQSGQWVPLDEYYYGTLEGDTNYVEEKGEYRFKCWYCSKMLYNNVRAMQHIQGHIDSTKQQNMDLSDLTQCKHCYKQFDTPFEMQTHVEKVHLSNKVLMCRICEKDFASTRDLIMHMRQNHLPCEMPYHCQLCGFRSSMYSDVVDHFKKKHDSSQSVLCLYCLRVFKVKFVSQGVGQTQTYYGHLLKHQAKTSMKKCNSCRLMFFNPLDVKTHRRYNHGSFRTGAKGVLVSKQTVEDQLMIRVTEKGKGAKKESQLKSLNAPSISKVQDYGGVTLPRQASTSECIECKMIMSSTDHYKKYINCSLCRFATSCSVAYANHMMGFHSGQMSRLNLNIPYERPLTQPMHCLCGFSSKYGTKMANHLVVCGKRSCSTSRPQNITNVGTDSKKDDSVKERGIFGALGLVQKKTMTTRVRTADSVKHETKSEKKKEKPQEIKTSRKRSSSPSTAINTDSDNSKKMYKYDTDPVKDSIGEKGDEGTRDQGQVKKGESKQKGNDVDLDSKDTIDVKDNVNISQVENESDISMKEKPVNLEKDEQAESTDIKDKPNKTQIDVDKSEVKSETFSEEVEEVDPNSTVNEDKANQGELVKSETEQQGSKDDGSKDLIKQTNCKETEDKNEINDSQIIGQSQSGEKSLSNVADEAGDVPGLEAEVPKICKENENLEKDSDFTEVKTNEEMDGKDDIDDEDGHRNPEDSEDMETDHDNNKVDLIEESDAMETETAAEENTEGDCIHDNDGKDSEADQSNKTDKKEESETIETSTEENTDGDLIRDNDCTESHETADKHDSEIDNHGSQSTQADEAKMDLGSDTAIKDTTTVDETKGTLESVGSDKLVKDGTKDEKDKELLVEGTAEGKGAEIESKTAAECKDKGEEVEKPELPQVLSKDEQSGQSTIESQSDRSSHSQQSDRQSHSRQSGRSSHSQHDRHRHGDRSHDRIHGDDRHGSQRSNDNHGNRPFDRNRDRDRSYDRDYNHGDHRYDNRYGSENRGGQGFRGHGGYRGQHRGYHGGHRGGEYNQDRNYNRNYGNRGGYHGGYRGGYY